MDNKKLPSLSVFFPSYNEEKNLSELIRRTDAFVKTITDTYELIVVDDGSTDHSKELLAKLCAEYPHLFVVTHVRNKGYGAALKSGIEAARYEWIFWTDSDLQFKVEYLSSFLPFVSKYDVLIGYRAHRADTFLRKANGQLYTTLINFLFGLRVRDIDCAFKLIRASELKSLHFSSSSAFTSAEILIRLKRKKARFYQLPVPHFARKRGSPTGGSFKVIFKGLRETVSFFIYGLHLF